MTASGMLTQQGCPYKVTMTLPPGKSWDDVECVGRIPYEQVLENYRSSTLVFPSYIESFGYPLAEARMVGTIVLAADTPFAREILAGYPNAYFFSSAKTEELVILMNQVLTGTIERKNVSQQNTATVDNWKFMMQQAYHLGGRHTE